MTRTAVLIRTHYLDDDVEALVAGLARDGVFDVFILADQTHGAIDTAGLPKISVTQDALRSLGLYQEAPNPLWRCGDYGLYVARREHPQYDAFWMVEPDVRLNDSPPSAILTRFPDSEAVDFLAGWLRPAKRGWGWTATMNPAEGPIWGCLFPLVRISARALDALLEARRRDGEVYRGQARDPAGWPNDEVFVASTLVRQGFACRDLNDFGQIYDEAGYQFWTPHTHGELDASGRPGWIYHPVLRGSRYFRKLSRLATKRGQLDELEQVLDRLAGVEWTQQEAEEHRRTLGDLRAQATARTGTAPDP